jgi:hypothetical protein
MGQGSLFDSPVCRYCGKDGSSPNHWLTCDGRQGRVEAIELPLLISGCHDETWDTSATAAISVIDTKDTQRQNVLATIQASSEGRTDDEIQLLLDIDGNSERPRRRELEMRGQIRMRRAETGEVVKRLTRTNRWAVVWEAA